MGIVVVITIVTIFKQVRIIVIIMGIVVVIIIVTILR